jgi:hypothetical protein
MSVPTGTTHTSSQLADELLGVNMVTSRKEMPEPLKSKNKIGKLRQGDVLSFRKSEERFLSWRDIHTAMILSTLIWEQCEVTDVPSRPVIHNWCATSWYQVWHKFLSESVLNVSTFTVLNLLNVLNY